VSNYGIKYNIITNSLECQFGLCHYDVFVETVEMDISFAYFGVSMKEMDKR
jgi:hypothetical protein